MKGAVTSEQKNKQENKTAERVSTDTLNLPRSPLSCLHRAGNVGERSTSKSVRHNPKGAEPPPGLLTDEGHGQAAGLDGPNVQAGSEESTNTF